MKPYRGYGAQIEYVADAQTFHGSVPGLRGAITFDGASVEALEAAFHESVDYYLDLCQRQGVAPSKPYSGTFIVRASPELHAALGEAARRANASVNSWVVATLKSALDGEQQRAPDAKAG